MFQCKEIVVYNNHGLYQVQSIGSLDFISSKQIYYTLQSLKTPGSKLYIPLRQKDKLRYTITKDMAAYCLLKLPGLPYHHASKASVRDLEYREVMSSNNYIQWLTLYKNISHVRQKRLSAKKPFYTKDGRALKQIEEMIVSEFSFALELPEEAFKQNLNRMVQTA